MKKTILILLLLVFVFQASPAFALELHYPSLPGIGTLESGQSLGFYVKYFVNLFFFIAVGVCALVLIAGGVLYITASQSPAALVKAKTIISRAFLGLFIILTSYLLLYAINPQLLLLRVEPAPVPKHVGVPTGLSPGTIAFAKLSPGEQIEATLKRFEEKTRVPLTWEQDFDNRCQELVQEQECESGSVLITKIINDQEVKKCCLVKTWSEQLYLAEVPFYTAEIKSQALVGKTKELQQLFAQCQCGTSNCWGEMEGSLSGMDCSCVPGLPEDDLQDLDNCLDGKCCENFCEDCGKDCPVEDIQHLRQELLAIIGDLQGVKTELATKQIASLDDFLNLERTNFLMQESMATISQAGYQDIEQFYKEEQGKEIELETPVGSDEVGLREQKKMTSVNKSLWQKLGSKLKAFLGFSAETQAFVEPVTALDFLDFYFPVAGTGIGTIERWNANRVEESAAADTYSVLTGIHPQEIQENIGQCVEKAFGKVDFSTSFSPDDIAVSLQQAILLNFGQLTPELIKDLVQIVLEEVIEKGISDIIAQQSSCARLCSGGTSDDITSFCNRAARPGDTSCFSDIKGSADCRKNCCQRLCFAYDTKCQRVCQSDDSFEPKPPPHFLSKTLTARLTTSLEEQLPESIQGVLNSSVETALFSTDVKEIAHGSALDLLSKNKTIEGALNKKVEEMHPVLTDILSKNLVEFLPSATAGYLQGANDWLGKYIDNFEEQIAKKAVEWTQGLIAKLEYWVGGQIAKLRDKIDPAELAEEETEQWQKETGTEEDDKIEAQDIKKVGKKLLGGAISYLGSLTYALADVAAYTLTQYTIVWVEDELMNPIQPYLRTIRKFRDKMTGILNLTVKDAIPEVLQKKVLENDITGLLDEACKELNRCSDSCADINNAQCAQNCKKDCRITISEQGCYKQCYKAGVQDKAVCLQKCDKKIADCKQGCETNCQAGCQHYCQTQGSALCRLDKFVNEDLYDKLPVQVKGKLESELKKLVLPQKIQQALSQTPAQLFFSQVQDIEKIIQANSKNLLCGTVNIAGPTFNQRCQGLVSPATGRLDLSEPNLALVCPNQKELCKKLCPAVKMLCIDTPLTQFDYLQKPIGGAIADYIAQKCDKLDCAADPNSCEVCVYIKDKSLAYTILYWTIFGLAPSDDDETGMYVWLLTAFPELESEITAVGTVRIAQGEYPQQEWNESVLPGVANMRAVIAGDAKKLFLSDEFPENIRGGVVKILSVVNSTVEELYTWYSFGIIEYLTGKEFEEGIDKNFLAYTPHQILDLYCNKVFADPGADDDKKRACQHIRDNINKTPAEILGLKENLISYLADEYQLLFYLIDTQLAPEQRWPFLNDLLNVLYKWTPLTILTKSADELDRVAAEIDKQGSARIATIRLMEEQGITVVSADLNLALPLAFTKMTDQDYEIQKADIATALKERAYRLRRLHRFLSTKIIDQLPDEFETKIIYTLLQCGKDGRQGACQEKFIDLSKMKWMQEDRFQPWSEEWIKILSSTPLGLLKHKAVNKTLLELIYLALSNEEKQALDQGLNTKIIDHIAKAFPILEEPLIDLLGRWLGFDKVVYDAFDVGSKIGKKIDNAVYTAKNKVQDATDEILLEKPKDAAVFLANSIRGKTSEKMGKSATDQTLTENCDKLQASEVCAQAKIEIEKQGDKYCCSYGENLVCDDLDPDIECKGEVKDDQCCISLMDCIAEKISAALEAAMKDAVLHGPALEELMRP